MLSVPFRVLCLLAVMLALLDPAFSRTASPPDLPDQWILVHPPSYARALAPLIEHRKKQGLKVVVVPTSKVLTPEQIRRAEHEPLREHLRQLCRKHSGRSHILLAGAIGAPGTTDPQNSLVPTGRGTISRMKGQPTDHGYASHPDQPGLVTAVGRFPARTVEEVEGMVAKTLAYENLRPGLWKRRLTVLAGIPAYNPLVDRLLEGAALARFERMDPAWTGKVVYTAGHSRFFLPDALLRLQSLAYIRQGQAYLLYLGHSSAEGLYAGPTADFLSREDFAGLRIDTGQTIFFTFGCNGCQLTGENGEGYGIHAMRNPQGPAAVIGSHGICFASMVQLGAEGVFRRALQQPMSPILGDTWLSLLTGIREGRIDPLTYRMLDTVDGDRKIPQAIQRKEHQEMFVLLGDPALRLPSVPQLNDWKTDPEFVPGGRIHLSGRLPPDLASARIRVSVERTATSLPTDLEAVPADPGPLRDRTQMANHLKANRFVVAETQAKAEGRAFSAQLELPGTIPWAELVVRVVAMNATAEAMGTRIIKKAPTEEKPTP